MAVVEYRNAPEILERCGPIIEAYHPHLIGYPIRVVWRSIAKKAGHKRVALGTAEIVRGRFAQFVMTDEEKGMEGQEKGHQMFWMEVAEDLWDDLTEAQQTALLDHELCHFGVEETDEGEEDMVILEHDVEEFTAIVRRHGLWGESLWQFGMAMSESMAVPDEL